jgi:beta-lactamase class C
LINQHQQTSDTPDNPKYLLKNAWLIPFTDHYAGYVDSSLKAAKAPGAAFVIIKDDEIIAMKAFGVKVSGTQDSVDIHTVFRLGSVSKGFAGIVTGMLVDEKLVRWTDPVVNYVPDFCLSDSQATSKVTVNDLLNHTTGLPKHSFTNMIEDGKGYDELKKKLKEVPLAGKPGKIFGYQNVAFSIIAEVDQKVTGIAYTDLLKQKIFHPCNMTDASDTYEEIMTSKNLAMPHVFTKKGYITKSITPEYYAFAPAAGVNASISDLSKYLLEITKKDTSFLSDSTREEIFKPVIRTPRQLISWKKIKKMYYAKGWRVLVLADDSIIYHGGYVTGYHAAIAIYPKDNIAVALLFNYMGILPNECIPKFFDMYFEFRKTNPQFK